jgi:hypothetical protein
MLQFREKLIARFFKKQFSGTDKKQFNLLPVLLKARRV